MEYGSNNFGATGQTGNRMGFQNSGQGGYQRGRQQGMQRGFGQSGFRPSAPQPQPMPRPQPMPQNYRPMAGPPMGRVGGAPLGSPPPRTMATMDQSNPGALYGQGRQTAQPDYYNMMRDRNPGMRYPDEVRFTPPGGRQTGTPPPNSYDTMPEVLPNTAGRNPLSDLYTPGRWQQGPTAGPNPFQQPGMQDALRRPMGEIGQGGGQPRIAPLSDGTGYSPGFFDEDIRSARQRNAGWNWQIAL